MGSANAVVCEGCGNCPVHVRGELMSVSWCGCIRATFDKKNTCLILLNIGSLNSYQENSDIFMHILRWLLQAAKNLAALKVAAKAAKSVKSS